MSGCGRRGRWAGGGYRLDDTLDHQEIGSTQTLAEGSHGSGGSEEMRIEFKNFFSLHIILHGGQYIIRTVQGPTSSVVMTTLSTDLKYVSQMSCV